MVAVPWATGVTWPDPSIIAVPVALLLQVPEGVASLRVVNDPMQTAAVPVTGDNGLTVTTVETEQPSDEVNEMFTVPAETPVTTPVDPATVAIPVASLLQAPGVVASLNVVVCPWQTVIVPVITAGSGYKATLAVPDILLVHPLDAFVARAV